MESEPTLSPRGKILQPDGSEGGQMTDASSRRIANPTHYHLNGSGPCLEWWVPAKWLCDAESVLVCVWVLITSRFQSSTLGSNAACSIAKKRAECVSLSLPVRGIHSKPYAVPSRSGRCYWGQWHHNSEFCKGDICETQRWNWPKRRKLPKTVKGDEVEQDTYIPTVDQTEEEKTPNGCASGRGHTEHICPNDGSGRRGENSQRLWKRKRTYRTYMSQWWIRQKRKPQTAVKADEVVLDMYVPMMDQTEEEKTPNGCESGRGRTEHICPSGGSGRRRENSQQMWRQKRTFITL